MAALDPYKRIVIKIGSALLVDAETGELRTDWLRGLAADVAVQKEQGRDVLIVSSGSIALGRRVLFLPDGVLSLEESQAAAAVGQIRLAQAYEAALGPLGIKTAQILLTLEDSADRRRYLNSRRTMTALLGLDVVPIVNENDTVATDEIRFGDNDRLAAQVAAMVGGDLLVLLSDVDGLYTGNPRVDKAAKHIPLIETITSEMEDGAGDAGTAASKGGMKTKVMAAKTAMSAGCAMVIMEGDVDRPLSALHTGVKASWFKSANTPNAARKIWISGMKPKGFITVDAGAITALKSGKSLLAVGVRGVEGKFDRGDVLCIQDENGRELAKGLAGYDADEAERIAGKQSAEIIEILGYAGRGALVHRDDMVL
jgi:glutamate 5-kinase